VCSGTGRRAAACRQRPRRRWAQNVRTVVFSCRSTAVSEDFTLLRSAGRYALSSVVAALPGRHAPSFVRRVRFWGGSDARAPYPVFHLFSVSEQYASDVCKTTEKTNPCSTSDHRRNRTARDRVVNTVKFVIPRFARVSLGIRKSRAIVHGANG